MIGPASAIGAWIGDSAVRDYGPSDMSKAKEMKRRILALIPDHPEILMMDHPDELAEVPGFRDDDLRMPEGYRVAALWAAQEAYRE